MRWQGGSAESRFPTDLSLEWEYLKNEPTGDEAGMHA